jgi:hypothetical protein
MDRLPSGRLKRLVPEDWCGFRAVVALRLGAFPEGMGSPASRYVMQVWTL